MLKKSVLVLFLAFPFFAFAQNTQVKLGHLDVQTLFASLPEVATIEATMKQLTEQHENEMKRMEDEYNRKLTEFQEGQQTWDDAIKKNRVEELQTLQTKMQNYFQSAQQSLQKRQEELQSQLKEKILKAINQVGADEGFLYIYDANMLLFKSEQSIDVTPLVRKKMDVK
jgi:outer membrane protein